MAAGAALVLILFMMILSYLAEASCPAARDAHGEMEKVGPDQRGEVVRPPGLSVERVCANGQIARAW